MNKHSLDGYLAFVGSAGAGQKPRWPHTKAKTLCMCILSLLCGLNASAFYPAGASGTIIATVLTSDQESQKVQVEYQLKAAFLFNFIKFVEWPQPQAGGADRAAAGQQESFRIGIIGADPFKKAFEGAQNKTIRNCRIEVIRMEGLSSFVAGENDAKTAISSYTQKYRRQIQSCQLLFICDSEKDFAGQIMEMIGPAQAIVVSDIENFARDGGIIGFVSENNKIRFDINLTEAQKKGLKISSQLLRLAREVIGRDANASGAQSG